MAIQCADAFEMAYGLSGWMTVFSRMGKFSTLPNISLLEAWYIFISGLMSRMASNILSTEMILNWMVLTGCEKESETELCAARLYTSSGLYFSKIRMT